MLKAISTITNALGALNYKGTWNASTNNPTLADGTGAKGDYYVTSTAGTQTFGGLQLFFGIGDWIVYNGAVWQRVEGGSDGNFANVTMTSTDAGAAAAPLLDLYRDSATPAASDTLGEIEFNGEDSAGNKQQYGLIHASILSPTSGAEQGQLHFETATGGASTEKMIIGTNNLVINEIGAVFNVRIEGDADANLFYTDATNDRIGVGTASPATKLDVNGTITATSGVFTTNISGNSGILSINGTNASGTYAVVQNSGAAQVYLGAWLRLLGSGVATDSVVYTEGAKLGLVVAGTVRATATTTGLDVTGTLGVTGASKLGGAESLKVWTYTHTITAGEVSAGVVNITVTSVTGANVRGFYVTYRTAAGIIFTEAYAVNSLRINSVRMSTATNVEVGLGVTAAATDLIFVTIIEAF